MKKIAVIVPCFNEEEALPVFIEKAQEFIKTDEVHEYNFIFVNDGSSDNTLALLEKYSKEYKNVNYISFSRNFGQSPAQIAGVSHAKGDYFVCMDVDLQDPLEVLPQMAAKLDEGYDIAQGVRRSREKDSFFKNLSAKMFYALLAKLKGKHAKDAVNSNTFRMFTEKVQKIIVENVAHDVTFFTLLDEVGFSKAQIPFDRPERAVGQTKYNLRKMINYSMNIVATQSTNPLLLIFKLALANLAFGLIVSIGFMIVTILAHSGVGSADFINHITLYETLWLIGTLFFVAGIILGAISVIALYVKSITINAQNKPLYIIDKMEIKK